MAEGDTIHRLARRIEARLTGVELTAGAPGRRRPAGLAITELSERRLERVEARGKHLLLHFDGNLVLHSHLGMNGSWHLYRNGEPWRKPAREAWLSLSGGGLELVNFRGTSMRLVREGELTRDPRLAGLGPDILGPGFDAARGMAALRSQQAERELGDALLDQRVIAGIGNIFKSEACFTARVSPWSRLGELSDQALEEVVETARALMITAVEEGRRKPPRVYRRAGRPCTRCRRAPVSSRPQGDDARTSYWCPACQPARGNPDPAPTGLPSAQPG